MKPKALYQRKKCISRQQQKLHCILPSSEKAAHVTANYVVTTWKAGPYYVMRMSSVLSLKSPGLDVCQTSLTMVFALENLICIVEKASFAFMSVPQTPVAFKALCWLHTEQEACVRWHLCPEGASVQAH